MLIEVLKDNRRVSKRGVDQETTPTFSRPAVKVIRYGCMVVTQLKSMVGSEVEMRYLWGLVHCSCACLGVRHGPGNDC